MANEISDLEEIFTEREEIYNDYTNALFEVLNETVLSSVYDVLNLVPDNVMWQEVQLIDGVILIIAIVVYQPGDEVSLEGGEKIKLDQETAKIYQRIIRIGIPLQLAALGSKDEVTKFLRESNHLRGASELGHENTATKIDGFSKEELNEDQIKQLTWLQRFNPGGKAH